MGIDFIKDGGSDMNFDPSSIFEQFFGGEGMGIWISTDSFGRENENSKEDCNLKLSVTLEQIYNESQIDFIYNQVYCKNVMRLVQKTRVNLSVKLAKGEVKLCVLLEWVQWFSKLLQIVMYVRDQVLL